MTTPSKSHLTPARRRLIEVMQAVNFGRIEFLAVRGGEPVFDPPPRVVREIKFGGDNDPRPERSLDDFAVKGGVAELLGWLARIGDGRVDVLEVKHGLPFRMTVAGTPAPTG